jgi:hypothetical protein
MQGGIVVVVEMTGSSSRERRERIEIVGNIEEDLVFIFLTLVE